MEELSGDVERTNPLTKITLRQHLFYVVLFCTAIAIVLSFAFSQSFVNELAVSYCFGLSTFGAFLIYAHYFRFRKATVGIPLVVGSLVGLVLAIIVSSAINGISLSTLQSLLPEMTVDLSENLLMGLGFGTLLLVYILSKVRTIIASDTLRAHQLKLAESEKQLAQAQLRLLQAQVEPHFLFNTLSNIGAMMEVQPSASRKMLEDLTHYLRATLRHSRKVDTTLGDELKLLHHYLAISQVRMGERLHYAFEVPAELMAHPLRPMLLQPLVENAIKHGLEPAEHGGSLLIKAERAAGILRITISDSGVGLRSASGSGFGIANVRERLTTLYEGNAKLEVRENRPQGVVAVLEVPDEQS